MNAARRSAGPAEAETLGRIDRVDEFVVRLPFVAPFSISSATWSCKEALLLRVEGEGAVGWGECVADPDPYYAPETVISARHIVREFLLPKVEPGLSFAELEVRLAPVRGNRMAKATLENALLDWTARRRGVPLCELLGFAPKPIPSGISIGLQESTALLVGKVEEALAQGYHRVKMKIARGRDVEFVRAVRAHFPEVPLMVDANSDYRLDDAARLAELDAFGLTMIEQPLATTAAAPGSPRGHQMPPGG
jgi:O-succinylbenzoate synthase